MTWKEYAGVPCTSHPSCSTLKNVLIENMRLSKALNQVSRAVMLLHCCIAQEKEEAVLPSLQTRPLLHGVTLRPCSLMFHESAKSHYPAFLETKYYKPIKRANCISPHHSGSTSVVRPLRLGMQGHPEKDGTPIFLGFQKLPDGPIHSLLIPESHFFICCYWLYITSMCNCFSRDFNKNFRMD